jgi:hypothetical protein
LKEFEGFPFDTTEEYIYLIYHALNKLYFHDNVEVERFLIYPKLNVRKKKPYEGYCEYFPRGNFVRISLSGNYFCGKLFVETILHEMIHVWQSQQYDTMNHGKSFINWELFFLTKNFEI